MPASIDEMNIALFQASAHLAEAGKIMSNVEAFRPWAARFLEMSIELAQIIEVQEPKVSAEKMESILDEILSLDDSETTEAK